MNKLNKNNLTKELIQLTENLITIESFSSDTKALSKSLDFVAKYLPKLNIYLTKFSKNGYQRYLISNQKNTTNFKILLNAHLDVVPADKNQFKTRIDGNKLYGRGAIDMKSAAAVMILVFKDLANKVNYPLGLQLVTDEEVGGFNGTKHQIEKGGV